MSNVLRASLLLVLSLLFFGCSSEPVKIRVVADEGVKAKSVVIKYESDGSKRTLESSDVQLPFEKKIPAAENPRNVRVYATFTGDGEARVETYVGEKNMRTAKHSRTPEWQVASGPFLK